MLTLQDVQAAVTASDTVIDSAVTLIQGLAAQVAALAPNQAAIDALAADIEQRDGTERRASGSKTFRVGLPANPQGRNDSRAGDDHSRRRSGREWGGEKHGV